jgi:hypothetical protein
MKQLYMFGFLVLAASVSWGQQPQFVTGDAVPDSVAYRMVFISLSLPDNPTAQDITVQQAKINAGAPGLAVFARPGNIRNRVTAYSAIPDAFLLCSYSVAHALHRFSGAGDPYFLTFSCYCRPAVAGQGSSSRLTPALSIIG